jgi:sugar phosphate isomerase/epimerase
MMRALSTHLFVSHRLTTVWLDKIWEAGIPLVEIFCARQHFDYRNKEQMAELGHWFRDSELKLHSIHAPIYSDDCWGRTGPSAVVNIAEVEKIRRVAAVDEIKRSLDLAEHVPFRYIIQHLGVSGDEYSEHKLDAAFQALEELKVFAHHRGVEVLLENIPNAMASAERLVAVRLEGHDLAPSVPSVRRDQHLGPGVVDPVLQRLRREPPEHHGVGGPDPGAGQHGHRELRDHR